MKNILVPTDLSDEGKAALEVGMAMAKSLNGHVTLLHIIDAPNAVDLGTQGQSSGSSIDQIFTLKLIERMKANLAVAVEPYGDDAPLTAEMAIGNLIEKINERVAIDNIDLVIMGTKGADGMHEVMVGSNAEKVVRNAHCPVLTVKKSATNVHPNNIAFASDFTENDQLGQIVPRLQAFQKQYGAKLHLVYVNTPNRFEHTSYSTKRMKNFVNKYGIENYTINIYNHRDEEDGILCFADENNMDMIAVATHSRKGLAHLLSG
ncbi:MAG: universal stress protein, partial [Bacteroidetes bacterium]|nr:universal stress protein [Bacteroidota bacterium]